MHTSTSASNSRLTSSPASCNDEMAALEQQQDEWVEIIEPKSKERIFANLITGVCAKYPPEKAIISRAEDFSDHWWELYDKKTGKYYYYNPDQQKTAWTKPVQAQQTNGNTNNNNKKKRLLIIPVSKLQTFKQLPSTEDKHYDSKFVEKCDASTQTIASNLVSTGTQTNSESVLANEFKQKIKFIDSFPQQESTEQTSSSCKHAANSTTSASTSSNKSHHLNHRQMSDLNARERPSFINKYSQRFDQTDSCRNDNSKLTSQFSLSSSIENKNKPSHHGLASMNLSSEVKGSNQTSEDDYIRYSGLNSSFQKHHQKDPTPISIKSPSKSNLSTQSPNRTSEIASQLSSSTSTFGNLITPSNHVSSKPPLSSYPLTTGKGQLATKMTTNNLSHYLVREARAMGIALISDDELDDDDQDSDDDFIGEFDEDTDHLRDDLSSHNEGLDDGAISELNVSQDLGEISSEGWKSLSDQESPNNTTSKTSDQQRLQHASSGLKKSPIHCETPASSSFTFNELIDDEKDPASCMSQQLDHRKLVENFKKSRQTSSFGLHDSLGRSYKLDPNQAVQKIKTVADSYFNPDKEQHSDRHLRQLSTLSTLPRPHKETKDKVALSKQDDLANAGNIDADYDIVEENCGYYSDSERQNQQHLQSNLIVNNLTGRLSETPKTNDTSVDLQSPGENYFDRNKSTRGSTFSVESFARENLTRHPKKGGLLFNRKVKWSRMISWTKNSIKQPMISSVSSDLSSDSIASFKLIQQFMGDRKVTITKKYRQILAKSGVNEESKGKSTESNSLSHSVQSTSSNTNVPNIPDRLRDELAFELVVKGCSKSPLRDEIYVQMARQLTENPNQDSISWGLILLSILLCYFSPSSKFSPFLISFLEAHSHKMARDVCLPRLEKRLRLSCLTYCRKPADGKEISIVRLSITKWPQYCGVFGESLERIMSLQTCSPYLKTLRLPWILTTLGDKLLETGGAETEGIFRCAADHDLIAQLRLEIDCVDFRKIVDAKQVHSLLSNVQDPHVIAGLLKLFFRQLQEPVFPAQLYDLCLQSGQEGGHIACRVFNDRLPNLNKDVVAYLIRLLQLLAEPDKVLLTKMDNSNLSMVWAPNLLRAPTHQADNPLANISGNDSRTGSKWSIANNDDQQQIGANTMAPSQSTIFEQTRQEMQFIRSLIVQLDTSFIEKVV